jgi:type II secretory pathway component PulC
MMRGALTAVLGGAFVVWAVACGGTSPPKTAAQPVSSASAPPAPPLPLPSNAVRRSAVHDVVRRGLGAFLQRVTVEDEPVFLAGKFHGFRIASLRGEAFWSGVDLKPGDVITRVNGFSIEHPEEALEAFKSLEVASELRVEYERNGVARELRYAIVDDEPAKQADASVSAPR